MPLDSVNFVTNDQLETVLGQTSATPDQIAEGIAINEDARLRALQISLLGLAGIALLAIIPAGRMPDYLPGDIPAVLSSGTETDDADLDKSAH
ncbi:hypothetical protein KIV56_01855 [Cryobacterium breve]|uniref:Uncharacterized protein n=1 Tax=Cryobacterium breve TaxID=1259258 RepID=A0ABY7NCR8_9MICO|nr:hypothetical protein KIV56_01855 [Cryobacterium breve]